METLVLLSGGVDSAACAAFYRQLGHMVNGAFVDYGQPVRGQEEESAVERYQYYGHGFVGSYQRSGNGHRIWRGKQQHAIQCARISRRNCDFAHCWSSWFYGYRQRHWFWPDAEQQHSQLLRCTSIGKQLERYADRRDRATRNRHWTCGSHGSWSNRAGAGLHARLYGATHRFARACFHIHGRARRWAVAYLRFAGIRVFQLHNSRSHSQHI